MIRNFTKTRKLWRFSFGRDACNGWHVALTGHLLSAEHLVCRNDDDDDDDVYTDDAEHATDANDDDAAAEQETCHEYVDDDGITVIPLGQILSTKY